MTHVIVTVYYEQNDPLDLSLPWEVPASEIMTALEKIFSIRRSTDSTLGLVKLGNNGKENLSAEETLADANILYGDELQLLVQGSPYLFTSTGQRFSLAKNLIVIGRTTPQQSVDVDLADLDSERVISRQHAIVEHRGDQYFIKDTNSSNGVYVNNRRIDPGQLRKLENGDMLQFGGPRGVELLFGIKN